MDRYPSNPDGLTARESAFREAFWTAVVKGEGFGAPAIARILKCSQSTVARIRGDLVIKGLVPAAPGPARTVPWEWGELVPEEFVLEEAAGGTITHPTAPSTYEALLAVLKKKKDAVQSIEALADQMDISPRRVREAADALTADGYNVFIEGDHVGMTKADEPVEATPVRTDGNRIRFGALSDTHLCSKRERLDVLNALYDWYAEEGITDVYHGGNWIEGESKFNVREIHTFGLDAQVAYFLKEYPQRPGITTHIVSGADHEYWYQEREGISIGKHMQRCAEEAGRFDLKHLGLMEHDVEFKNDAGSFIMRVVHAGGGSAYALSYSIQKLVESYQGGEKPAVLLVGHYHKMEYLPAIRNVKVYQLGCTVDQSVWARKKKLSYHVGGWMIELTQCPRTGACIGAKSEDRTFFDRKFHQEWDDA